jgi:hypothetical protein
MPEDCRMEREMVARNHVFSDHLISEVAMRSFVAIVGHVS